MFDTHVVPALEALPREPAAQVLLRSYGLPESSVNDRLSDIETAFDVTLGYRARFPEVDVKVLAYRDNLADAERAARRAAEAVRERLGGVVFAEGDLDYPAWLGALLAERGASLGLAESCTGGLVAELMTRVPGASRYLLGSLVTYANRAKETLLGVPGALIERHGAVSAEVACAMAEGARRALGADFGLAVTGIAGPGGATAEKPVGLVHFAVSDAAGTAPRERVFAGTRAQVRRRAAYAALALLAERLQSDSTR
jgi:nicotinamide-nucleotide amidase